MEKIQKTSLTKIDLTENIWIYTDILEINHAAIRSGFAGYPANPRWNISKFRAWKQGKQWRENLLLGRMTVRQDAMLVAVSEGKVQLVEEKPARASQA